MITGYSLPQKVTDAGYSLVPATFERLNAVAQNMNTKDAAEVWALAHRTPFEGLRMSEDYSVNATAVLSPEGVVLCAMGVASYSLLASVGQPWFLGTCDVPRHAKALLRSSRSWVEHMQNNYDVLENMVDARYAEAVRWVKWLGFTVYPSKPIGPDGVQFHPIRWEK